MNRCPQCGSKECCGADMEAKIELLEAQLKWMEKINRKLREEPSFAFWLDSAEAADRIEELEAEVERLREAIRD